ncbi:glycosyltransferase family 4 protein [Dictyobacter kobayashii]|uniref:Glycosyl transferase n=1 Tax=Dictyobacter kobayashii TaxID=2014872 RepID=A0A402AWR1_9CHLR|nr:glycosyltransferase family 4 protein [Dictyobacter kobayashii]GCE23463.1 glycosyl transferase [Dictyobacter kobayashii]
MRILFVTPQVPSRMRARSFNLLKALSKKHDIALVSLLVDKYDMALLKEVEPYCASIDLVPHTKWQSQANRLRALVTRIPLSIAALRSATLIQCLKEVVQRQHIDLIHAEVITLVPALNALREEIQIPIVYDAVNCASWLLQQKLDTTHDPLKRWFIQREMQKMRQFEASRLAQFEQIIIASASDRDRLGLLMEHPHNIKVVSNCVDTDYFKPGRSRPRHTNSLIFCARLDNCSNAQAILHFCARILPLIWQAKPETCLTIVGPNPPIEVKALEADKRITVTGYVPDTRSYLDSAAVALAPLLVPTGPQFKILEALAMETPVVTTPRCSRALGTSHGQHLLVAEGPRPMLKRS